MTRYVGKSYKRKEDYRLLTGTGSFVADMNAFNMVEACFVRSTHASAHIKHIDTSKACKVDDVLAVITAKDIEGEVGPLLPLPDYKLPQTLIDEINPVIHPIPQDILAKDRVCYTGQPIAVVLAKNRYIAEDAAALIEVEYEPLEVLTDPYEAMKEGVPTIHSHMTDNVQASFHLSIGEVDEAFQNADHILTSRIKIPRLASSPMETRGIFATYDRRQGELNMWASTQAPHTVRTYLSKMLQLAENNIRVVAPDVGGGFGPKGNIYPEEIIIGYLTMKFNRPVKWIEDRLEHFISTCHSRDQIHDVQVAIRKDGTIVGMKDEFVLDSGAYNPTRLLNVYNTACHLRGIFKIPNFEAEGKCVLTNKTPIIAYRGAGRPEASFVMDRMIYHIAKHLDMDPLDVITKNMVQPDEVPYDTGMYYRDGTKLIYDSGDYPALLQEALDVVNYDNFRQKQQDWKKEGKSIGIGISSYIEGTGVGPYEGALIRLDPSGQIIAFVGSAPHGQSHETTFAQICADEFGITPEQVTVKAGDTRLIPHGVGTHASRSAVVAGSAVQIASQKLREKLLAVASEMLVMDSADLDMNAGRVYPRALPDQYITFQEIAAASKPGPQTKVPKGMEAGAEACHYFVPPTVTISSGFHIAVVEVDKQTGFLEILRYIVVHDCGKALNPMIVDGQIQGGLAQGIGEAIYEEILYDKSGQLLTGSFMDYLLPTAMDVPDAEMRHQEMLSPHNQLGVKGVGEGGAISPLAAIANAVGDALSPLEVSLDELPLSPNRLFHLIEESRKSTC